MMIPFVENKKVDFKKIKEILSISKNKNHWTNFGPVSLELEKKINKYFPNKKVICCSSGTTALHALINMNCFQKQKKIKWIVPSYTFFSSKTMNLNVKIIDCDINGLFPLNLKETNDGIIITDLWSGVNLNNYKIKNKNIIIDSACALDKKRNDDFDHIVSFHHTKPWGFGEGGCIITDKLNENLIRSIINFGNNSKAKNVPTKYCMNAKMSDISAAFILTRLEDFEKEKIFYQENFLRIKSIASFFEIKTLINPQGTPSNVPLLFNHKIENIKNPYVVLNKYYKPLKLTKNALSIYEKIVNFPCHKDINKMKDKEIKKCLELLIKKNE